MKNQLQSVAMTIFCWLLSNGPALAKCEPILDVSPRTWGVDVRITSASTQGDCAYVITTVQVGVPAAQAAIPIATANSWTYIRPREADSCEQQRRTSAAYGPPAGVNCLANLSNGDGATLLLQRLAPTAEECYDITVRPVLAEAVNPNRARQLICLPPTADVVATRSRTEISR